MKQSTSFAQVANSIKNLLQEYTKGIRITAILILLLMGVSNAWAWWFVPGSWNSWDSKEANSGGVAQMNGSNTITFYNVPAGSYEMKLIKGSDWGNGNYKNKSTSYISSVSKGTNGGNDKIKLSKACDLTFTITNQDYWNCDVSASDPSYYIKYDWNGSGWAWSGSLTSSNSYSCTGQYGGSGSFDHTRVSSTDVDGTNATATLVNSPSKGDLCVFTYNTSNKSLTITRCNKVTANSKIYFDNSLTNWSNSNIYFVVGHDKPTAYSKVYKMNAVNNTKLFYAEISDTWEDATYYAFVGVDNEWSNGNWGTSNLTNASKRTKAYTSKYDLNSNSSYYFAPSEAANDKAFTISASVPSYNATQSAKVRNTTSESYSTVNGNWPATLKLKGTHLSGDGASGRSEISSTKSSDGNDEKVYGAVVTGKITHSYSNLSEDYQFDGWGTSTPAAGNTYEYHITAATTVYAFFTKKHAVNFGVHSSGGGTISAKSGSTTLQTGNKIVGGSQVVFTASPSDGYRILGWYSDANCQTSLGNGTNTTYTISSLEQIANVYVKFEKTWTVTIANDGNGTTAPNAGNYTVGAETGIDIDATPTDPENYEFLEWTSSVGGSFASPTTFAENKFYPTANTTLTATFRSTATYALTVGAGHGVATVSGSQDPIDLGSTYPISATLLDGYKFTKWTAEPAANATFASASDPSTTVTVLNGSVTVTATATENTVVVSPENAYDAGNPGYAAPTVTNEGVIGIKSTSTLTASEAQTGYTFAGWELSDNLEITEGDKNSRTITIRHKTGDGSAVTVVAKYNEDLSTSWVLKGSFVDDFKTAYKFVKKSGESTGKVAYVSLDLADSKAYQFKVVDGDTWYGNNNSNEQYWIKATAENWEFYSDAGNCHMKSSVAGTYTFKIDFSGAYPKVSVQFPTAYKVTYGVGNNKGTDAVTTNPNITSGSLVLASTSITFSKSTTKTGYTWKGWYNNAAGTGDAITTEETYTSENRTDNISVYACYGLEEYTITYNLKGGEGEMTPTSYNVTSTVTLPTPTRTGYTFKGWCTDVECTSETQTQIAKGSTGHKTFYAKWECIEVTGISLSMTDGHHNLNVGETNQLLVTYTPTGALCGTEIKSWSSSNINVVSVSETGLVTAIAAGIANITATTTDDISNHYKIKVNNPDCDSWYLHYWNATTGGDECFVKVKLDDATDHEWRTANISLPSASAEDMFNVNNHKAGDSGDAKKKDKVFYTIGFADIQRGGQNCGSNPYPGQDAYGQLSIYDDSDSENRYIAFYPAQYLVTFGKLGQAWDVLPFTNTGTLYEYESELFEVPNGYKTSSSYQYYVGVSDREGNIIFVENKSHTDDIKAVNGLSDSDMAGKWGRWHIWSNSCANNWYCEFVRYYRVNFDLAGGDGEIAARFGKYSATITFSTSDITAPTRAGYTFLGWKDQKGTNYAPIDATVTINDDLKLTAQWAQNHTLSYDMNGGDGTGCADAVYYAGQSFTVCSAAGNKVGYTFNNWLGSDGKTYTAGSSATMPNQGLTLVAQWTPNIDTKYQVKHYQQNIGSDEYTLVETEDLKGTTDSQVTPSVKNYEGFTSPTPTEVTIKADGSLVVEYQYTRNSYTVTWDVDGVTTTETYEYGADIEKPADPTKTGYTFAGWSPAVDATMPAKDVTYTATWTVNQYTVTWIVDASTTTDTYTYGATIVKPADPTKTGYTFDGWSPNVADNMPAENVTYTATWTINTYTVQWSVNGQIVETQTIAYGANALAPGIAPPYPCDADVFVGWIKDELEMNETDRPADEKFVTNSPTITEDTTFYAVFADYEN